MAHPDDYDDYYDDDENELNEEDQAMMASSSATVLQRLGEDSRKVTKSQIEEALWHYYYDIDKTVQYLTKTYISPPPPIPAKAKAKPAPSTKPNEGERSLGVSFSASQFCCFAEHDTPVYRATEDPAKSTSPLDNPTSKESGFPLVGPIALPPSFYFHGMSWLSIPEHRRATLDAPCFPRGGLLGGGDGPKLSKLQALAAARKKKAEAQRSSDGVDDTRTKVSQLSISDTPLQGNPTAASNPAKRQKLDTESSAAVAEPGQVKSVAEVEVPTQLPFPDEEVYGKRVVCKRKEPSAFARMLFPSSPRADTSSDETTVTPFPPYLASPLYDPTIFDKPSPDDIVLAAQAQGSRFVRKE